VQKLFHRVTDRIDLHLARWFYHRGTIRSLTDSRCLAASMDDQGGCQ